MHPNIRLLAADNLLCESSLHPGRRRLPARAADGRGRISSSWLRRPPLPRAPDRGIVGSSTAHPLRRGAREFRDPIESWVIPTAATTFPPPASAMGNPLSRTDLTCASQCSDRIRCHHIKCTLMPVSSRIEMRRMGRHSEGWTRASDCCYCQEESWSTCGAATLRGPIDGTNTRARE